MDKRTGVLDLVEQAFLLGLGAASLTRERIDRTVDELVERGRMSREEAREVADRMSERGAQERGVLREAVRDEIRKMLDRMEVATKEDIRRLEAAIAAVRAEDTEAHIISAPEQPEGDLPPDVVP